MRNGAYCLVIPPSNYPGKRYRGRYAYEHHVVYWRENGLLPSAGERVHHIDGNPRNNDLANLELVTTSQHMAIHHGVQYVACVCPCGKSFKIAPSKYRARMKANQHGLFCSRGCGATKKLWGTRAGSRERTVNASLNAVEGSNPSPTAIYGALR